MVNLTPDHLIKPSSLHKRQERQMMKQWELESWTAPAKVTSKARYRGSAKGKRTERDYQLNHQRGQDLLRLYGWTPKDWDNALTQQNGHCAICPSTDRLCVDHDHATKKPRGILCWNCNVGLGKLGDNETGLLKALAYVRGLPWPT